jgi:hypothetical protein
MDVPLEPIIDRVLMRRKIVDKIGSIVVPRDSREVQIGVAEVISKGDACKIVEPGDVVLFGRYAAVAIDPVELGWYGIVIPDTDNYVYLFCNEKDLIAVAGRASAKEEANAT